MIRLKFQSPQQLSSIFDIPVDNTNWNPPHFVKTVNGWTPVRARASFRTVTHGLIVVDPAGSALANTYGLYALAIAEPEAAIYIGIAAGGGRAPEGILSRIRKHRVKLTGSHVGASPQSNGGVHHPEEWRNFAAARHKHFVAGGREDICADVRLVLASLDLGDSSEADGKGVLEAIESAIVNDVGGVLRELCALLWDEDMSVRLLTTGSTSRRLSELVRIEYWNGSHIDFFFGGSQYESRNSGPISSNRHGFSDDIPLRQAAERQVTHGRALNASESDLFSRLVRLMGCREERAPTIEVDEESEPQRLLKDLIDLMEGEEWGIPSLLDILGTYTSATQHVTVYRRLIERCAGWLCVDPHTLENVVLTHELAHAASHIGLDSENNIWRTFDSASSAEVEYFAQIFAHVLFRESHEHGKIQCMDTLATRQPAHYTTYLSRTHVAVADLAKELYDARRRARTASTFQGSQPQSLKKCTWCRRVATTSVARWDTWLMKSWSLPSCERCARTNQQTWLT
jgi:hypothetical protein